MKTRRPIFFFARAMIFLTLGLETMSAASSSTPEDVFDAMRKSFRADKAKGVNARYQFELSGPNGGSWFIEVNNGKSKIARGRIDNSNVTLVASDKDWVALSNGKLNGSWAFLTGRLKIRGDHGLAKKLGEIFP